MKAKKQKDNGLYNHIDNILDYAEQVLTGYPQQGGSITFRITFQVPHGGHEQHGYTRILEQPLNPQDNGKQVDTDNQEHH